VPLGTPTRCSLGSNVPGATGALSFPVYLPSPLSPVGAFISGTDQSAVQPADEKRLLEELVEITAALTHDQLAVQWDANFEFAMVDGSLLAWFADVQAGVVERLVRMGGRVPDGVEPRFHLCHAMTAPTGLRRGM
jgi:hypothetical protein